MATPYTDADVDLVHDAIVDARLAGHRDWTDRIARAVLDALAAAGRLAPADDDPRHIIEIRDTGWTIKHPLSCRLGDLFGCAVNLAAEDLDGTPVPPGRYAVTVDSIDGRIRIGDRVDQGDAPHVIKFHPDATWTLEHPPSCRAAALDVDCPVWLLAQRQIPADLAQLMADGRYTCSAGDLGDLFQLGERLHDDQCTQPICAACGCWCHAEEQTEA